MATGSTGVTDISFAGNSEDTVGSLYDAQFREYGIQGRWPSPDPAGIAAANPANPQSWNRYAYVLNNPLIFTDPSGLDDCPSGQVWNGSACVVPTVVNVNGEPDDSFDTIALYDPFGFYGQLEIFGNPRTFGHHGDLCGGGDCVNPNPQPQAPQHPQGAPRDPTPNQKFQQDANDCNQFAVQQSGPILQTPSQFAIGVISAIIAGFTEDGINLGNSIKGFGIGITISSVITYQYRETLFSSCMIAKGDISPAASGQ